MDEHAKPESHHVGASVRPGGDCEFVLWAPKLETVEIHLLAPEDRILAMQRGDDGYHHASVRVPQGAQYLYRLPGGGEFPDPASSYQPDGVHGPSEVFDTRSFEWSDSGWMGRALEDYILYEAHVGTYTPAGTFDAMIPYLPQLRDLGITAIEIMPVAQFPGRRNWGYDGVYPFAVQNSYGGPMGLQKLVDSAHRHGLAVVLDVVYNHLGPEGNYFGQYAPYFTNRYGTPWGAALNFDGPQSDEVRRFFIENALYWLRDFHIDGLRLDAINGIFDTSAIPFLAQLGSAADSLARETGRHIILIAESDLNDVRVLRARGQGGFGHDAQWSDDFHHALHVLLTGEQDGYYMDFGGIHPLSVTLQEGWFFSGRYSKYRQRHHGNSPRGFAPHRFVVCIQNHDQVGNRAEGERLSRLVSFDGLKLAAGATLLSPFVPMMFMGEEYGETAPFLFFTDHGDQQLIEAVRRGRQEEYRMFMGTGEIADPQGESTFLDSKLDHSLNSKEPHRTLRSFYQRLLQFRRLHLPFDDLRVQAVSLEAEKSLALRYSNDSSELLTVFNFSDMPCSVAVECPAGFWQKQLDSADAEWQGPGNIAPERLQSDGRIAITVAARSFVVFQPGSE
ncbi:MAG: malto-oligosyltrehalose trehalohydrolase [Silvibacterium sp.]